MKSLRLASATFIGQVTSVRGGEILVRLRDVPTTLVMVDGSSYRIGQIGAFVRIPLGYTQLYGVCTQIGADVMRSPDSPGAFESGEPDLSGYRWMTVVLFGEATQVSFERGVAQYPTVGDEVHLATSTDMEVIYSDAQIGPSTVSLGHIAGAPDIPAVLNIAAIVTRHACVVGSTGSGKSNLMAVLLRAIASSELTSARVLVVDPHGEYASALAPGTFSVQSAQVGTGVGLRVPYWALGFDELAAIAFGPMSDQTAEYIREKIRELKISSAAFLAPPIASVTISADSPVPFSLRRVWFELRRFEDETFTNQSQLPGTESPPTSAGDEDGLVAAVYPAAGAGSSAPFLSKKRKGVGRQLDFLRARLLDPRFAFMFAAGDEFDPDHDGRVASDLDGVIAKWIGGNVPITILDVSGLPPEVVDIVVGALLTLVYEALFWGMYLTVGGKRQPLLVVMDEAHRFIPAGSTSISARISARIAREGRKYGVGLMVVTQRPSDIDPTILSQCGSMISLRVTNSSDRAAVSSTVPDDLGNLTALLPSLRTGECLVLGEALQIPSRVRVAKAPSRPIGDDPVLPQTWQSARPDPSAYSLALHGWRSQNVAPRDD